ncbi:hypothetical protein KP509_21G009500 [Ceratopteris richardii]|uniref:Uncharacterized protein n=3 Tax=Ceratopteris richardii TaxID=49495 RepID=A0A8T2SAP6_CERRI|nr:hypothetical protein KP509_21G009500 [Ceratopteris richardii]KAH7314577.1 hypothetical protein KP509_21G009500 [Ceratopteris richardii]KAH7314578.1 hypothetical protein KP509_21G009500 [Ceratopteris richardii]KAH7314579.1 hypothetical protein KP509_21G009500 [Ceratopteris richardii]KAH7314581.1 hypothetical protein KP509_21G009500 [Ceratopteris richardii]
MAKVSLMHKFTQVLLSPNKEVFKDKFLEQNEDSDRVSGLNLSSRRQRRMRLEIDVERLHERLQQETDLHCALESAITRAAGAFSTFPRNLPVDAQELLADVAMLEVAVSGLERQILGLQLQLRHERDQRIRNTAEELPSILSTSTSLKQEEPGYHSFKASGLPSTTKFSDSTIPEVSTEPVGEGDPHASSPPSRLDDERAEAQLQEMGAVCCTNYDEVKRGTSCGQEFSLNQGTVDSDSFADIETDFEGVIGECYSISDSAASISGSDVRPNFATVTNSRADGESYSSERNSEAKLWKQPNRLSQQMVSCMIGIYRHLSDPTEAGKNILSDNVPSPNSPFGHVISSSVSSISDSFNLSYIRSPSTEAKGREQHGLTSTMDPYRTHDKVEWGDVGSYSSAIEVSWMSVGKEQLEYAADALRVFRSLVEQLSRVDVASLSHNEKLAFWINIYNALMMHAYLAYGVPKNDVKYFALIQKAAYTVGGHFFNAVAIEHVLLRGKAPSYRPQIALLLALHKIKVPEGALKLAIIRPEPLVSFALSCGAWSSPAVRVYMPETVQKQLRTALHDYVRASVGVGRNGKLLIPKLMYCYLRDLEVLKLKGDQTEVQALIRWVSSFLPTHQANILLDAVRRTARHRPRPQSALITVQPFNLRLRYLFLQ